MENFIDFLLQVQERKQKSAQKKMPQRRQPRNTRSINCWIRYTVRDIFFKVLKFYVIIE